MLIGGQATEDFTSIEATVVWQHIDSKRLLLRGQKKCDHYWWWWVLRPRLGAVEIFAWACGGSGSPDMGAVRGRQGSALGRVSFSWNCQSVCIQWLWSIIAGQWRRLYSSQPEYQPAAPARCSQLFLIDACYMCQRNITKVFTIFGEYLILGCSMLVHKDLSGELTVFRRPFIAVREGNNRPYL